MLPITIPGFFFVFALMLAAPPAMGDEAPSDRASTQAIYGKDDRRDWYQVNDAKLLRWARSTVALISYSNLKLDKSTQQYSVTAETYQKSENLCSNQPFLTQPAGGFCSGFLVAPDLIATAGHCLSSFAECKDTAFVFDYAIGAPSIFPHTIAASNVYSCLKIVARRNNNHDFAIIKLNRKVPLREPLQIRRSGTSAKGSQLTLIGHPGGLPSKIADGGKVLGSSGILVQTNVDAFGGNSGSVVMNRSTGLVEGILVSGGTDYSPSGKCMVEHICKNDCEGEQVYPARFLAPYIPTSQLAR